MLRALLLAVLLFPTSAVAQQAVAPRPLFGRYTAGDVVALSTGNADERAAAAVRLGRFGDRNRALRALSAAFTTEGHVEVRRAIIEALGRRGGSAVVSPLRAALRQGAESDRVIVARALGAIGSHAAIETLAAMLGDEGTSRAAREGLARAGAAALPSLLRAAEQPASAVAAIEALGMLGDDRALPTILRALSSERPDVKLASLDALRRLEDPRAASEIAALLGQSPDVTREALAALVPTATRDEASAIEPYLASDNPDERRLALRAYTHADLGRAVPALARALDGDDLDLSRAASDALLATQRREAAPLLATLLVSGTTPDAAASALAELEDGAGMSALLEGARDTRAESGERRIAAERGLALALHRHEDTPGDVRAEALAVLQRARTGRDVERLFVLRALARDASLAPHLVHALETGDATRRAAAALATEILGDRSLGAALGAAIGHETDAEAFRRLASAALALRTPVSPSALTSALENDETFPEAAALAAFSRELSRPRAYLRLRALWRTALRSSDPRVRAGAARALSIAADRDAYRALLARLDDEAKEVRAACARALEVLAVPAAVATLQANARVEADERVRSALLDAAVAPDRRPLDPLVAGGDLVLQVRVTSAAGSELGVPVDVVTPDGLWLRLRTLPSGDVLLPGLPAGTADVRVRIGDD